MDKPDVDGFFQRFKPARFVDISGRFLFTDVGFPLFPGPGIPECEDVTVILMFLGEADNAGIVELHGNPGKGDAVKIIIPGIEQLIDKGERKRLPVAVRAVDDGDTVVMVQGDVVAEYPEEFFDRYAADSHGGFLVKVYVALKGIPYLHGLCNIFFDRITGFTGLKENNSNLFTVENH